MADMVRHIENKMPLLRLGNNSPLKHKDMTDQQRTEAWNNLPEQMRKEIILLYQSFWVTFNTRKRMEEIFGRENLNQDK